MMINLTAKQFMEKVREGCVLTPTDKNYKVYVNGSYGKFYFDDPAFTQEMKQEFIDLLNAKKIGFDYPGYFYVKPYFFA